MSLMLVLTISMQAQNLPLEAKITEDGRLVFGSDPVAGLYDPTMVNKLEITLEEDNWFELMESTGNGPNAMPGQTLIARLTFNDDIVLDSVFVSIKGQTSDFQNNSEKKSFSIQIDDLKDQDLLGYDNLNLNCGFQDHSSMREVLFGNVSRGFTTGLKGSFVDLYFNGEYWGPYGNIQQLEGRYINEWFTNNDGTRWRALRTSGGGGGPGGPGGPGGAFGTGVSSLNYHGQDTSEYTEYYTLKKTNKADPWSDLVRVCDALNNSDIQDLYDNLIDILDIDHTLWFLAQEMIFADDDSYINKGGMDYYVYWDESTDRLMPMEVDANSVMADNHLFWSPFYNENDSRFPLLNRLLQNSEVRQRYLAHMRTILKQHFIEDELHSQIDAFASLLDQRVQDDPKKLYSHTQFINGVNTLKNWVSSRIDYFESHDEIMRDALEIQSLTMESAQGINQAPLANQEAIVSCQIIEPAMQVWLYYGLGLDGKFERVEMFDNGMDSDVAANDGVYTAFIPAFNAGSYVRYYVEAIKNDGFGTASYYPEGAEHDVFIYQVEADIDEPGDLVINEFMASNSDYVSDLAGEFDDWIELYNNSNELIDLTGFFLSDDFSNVDKWAFPENTIIDGDSYLIVWADEDDDQASNDELHANFKLDADGEILILSNDQGDIIDLIEFGEQVTDLSSSRIPNGTGSFEIKAATFMANNEGSSSTDDNATNSFKVHPNPASNHIHLLINGHTENVSHFQIIDMSGRIVIDGEIASDLETINISDLQAGLYFISLANVHKETKSRSKFSVIR